MGLDAGLVHIENKRSVKKEHGVELGANNHPDQPNFIILRPERPPVHRHIKIITVLSRTGVELAQELELAQHLNPPLSNSNITQIKD